MLSDSKDDLVQRALELLRKQPAPTGNHRAAPLPTLHPGSLVTWTRGDGTRQIAFIDCLHTDPDGKQWAFVSWGKNWAAIDATLLTVVRP